MASISIPRSAFNPLQRLIGLDEASFEGLLRSLSDAQAKLSRSQFCREVAAGAADDELADEIESIVDELFDIASLGEQARFKAKDMAKEIREAAIEASCKEFPIGEREADILEGRLRRLLDNSKSLNISAKAAEVLTDHDHLFYSARLFTDVRPIFGESTDSISAAVIVHNLVIHYGEAGDHKDFHVSLDNSDIRLLRSVLDRAEAKAKTLEALLAKTRVSYLDVENPD